MDKQQRIVIVGGGIAGLAAGYYAQRLAEELELPLSLRILESSSRFGGKIRTKRKDGFVIEGGPDTFVRTKPWAMQLCSELGMQDRLHGTNPHFRTTYILREGHLHPLPGGLTMMIPTELGSMATTGLLSWKGKARMAWDYILPPRREQTDESMGAFVTRRLGREAYEQLIEPLLSGIYAGDGDRLSLQSTFPFLQDLERKHGGLIRGALAMRKARSANGREQASVFMTPKSGLAEIIEALQAELTDRGAELVNEAEVIDLESTLEGVRLRLAGGIDLHAEAVVLATPSYTAADILRELDPGLSLELASIEYVSTATVTLAYPADELPTKLDGYGYVIPRREGRKALACTWTSSKFPHRAPDGHALLRVFIGRAGQEHQIQWEEPELLRLAMDELETTLGIDRRPEFSHVQIFRRAMPQYDLGHPGRVERIEGSLADRPWLALAGAAYRGIGIPDCIHSGERAAQRVVSYVAAARAGATIEGGVGGRPVA